MNAANPSSVYAFGEFRIDPVERTLLRGEDNVALAPKSFDVLFTLVQHRGRLVERQFLMSAVWADTAVEENSLSKAIADIRKALGEGARDNRYIVTISKRGYRFVAEVTSCLAAAPPHSEAFDSVLTLAVLPFRWLTQLGSDGPLAIGLADALITRLSNLPQIVVRPTSSILQFSDGDRDPIAVGNALKVSYVISGSLQQAEDRVRVTVQMVSPDQQRSIWADHFEETFTHIFTVEDSISARVAEALALKLTSAQVETLARPNTENLEAYQLYLRGRYFWSSQTFPAAQKAIAFFQQAVELDPNYALAWAGIADGQILLALSGALSGAVAPHEIYPDAKAAAVKAIDLNSALPEPHSSLGFIKMFYEWEPAEAHREFQVALALQPKYSSAYHGAALSHGFCGQFEQALECIDAALAIEPQSLIYNANKGYLLYIAGRTEESLNQLWKTVEMAPQFAPTHYRLGMVLSSLERYDEAIRELEETARLSDNAAYYLGALGYIYGQTGREEDARTALQHLIDVSKKQYVSPVLMAEICAGLRRYPEAIDCLERAVLARTGSLFAFNVDPRFEALRAQPRFQLVQHSLLAKSFAAV